MAYNIQVGYGNTNPQEVTTQYSSFGLWASSFPQGELAFYSAVWKIDNLGTGHCSPVRSDSVAAFLFTLVGFSGRNGRE